MRYEQTWHTSLPWGIHSVDRAKLKYAAETDDPAEIRRALTGHAEPRDITLSIWAIGNDEKSPEMTS